MFIPGKKIKEEFWLTNISMTRDVALGDLRITIRAGKSVNLLNGHYKFLTREMIETSLREGSVFNKRNVIKVRKVAPEVISKFVPTEDKSNRGTIRQLRKPFEIEIPHFEELDVKESMTREERLAEQERLATENADLDMMDKVPALPVDPKFKPE